MLPFSVQILILNQIILNYEIQLTPLYLYKDVTCGQISRSTQKKIKEITVVTLRYLWSEEYAIT